MLIVRILSTAKNEQIEMNLIKFSADLMKFSPQVILYVETMCALLHLTNNVCPRHTYQILAPENWYQNLTPVLGTSCKISGNRNKHGIRR